MVVVFILYLDEDDSLAAFRFSGKLFIGQLLADSIKPVFTPADMLLISTSEPATVIIDRTESFQPARISPTGKLCTNKRTRTDNGLQSEFYLSHFQPASEICKIEMTVVIRISRHGSFMPVPGHISFYSIESSRFDITETVAP